jgi:hypothetical protein
MPPIFPLEVTVRVTVYCGPEPTVATITVTWPDGTSSTGSSTTTGGAAKIVQGVTASVFGKTVTVTVQAQDGAVVRTVPIK